MSFPCPDRITPLSLGSQCAGFGGGKQFDESMIFFYDWSMRRSLPAATYQADSAPSMDQEAEKKAGIKPAFSFLNPRTNEPTN